MPTFPEPRKYCGSVCKSILEDNGTCVFLESTSFASVQIMYINRLLAAPLSKINIHVSIFYGFPPYGMESFLFIIIQTWIRKLGGKYMAKCPKCGTEVANPKRRPWTMAGRPDKTGKKTELTIGLFGCPKCGTTFRHVMGKRKV